MSSGGATTDEPQGAHLEGPNWTGRRRRLQAALAQRDELFGDLYGRAIDALCERPLRRGSLVIAGHCMRDLVNGLPDVLADVDGLPAYNDMTTPTRALSEVWAQHEDLLGSVDAGAEAPSATDLNERVTVPTALVQAARRVVRASRAAADNAVRRHSALVLGRVETRQDATVKLFRDSVSVFERLRHPSRGREIAVGDNLGKVVQALEVIEGALAGRMGRFFETVEDLMDLLEAANKRDGVERE